MEADRCVRIRTIQTEGAGAAAAAAVSSSIKHSCPVPLTCTKRVKRHEETAAGVQQGGRHAAEELRAVEPAVCWARLVQPGASVDGLLLDHPVQAV